MDKKTLTEKAGSHLSVLCSEIGERRVGGEGNRRATAYVEKALSESGWRTEATELDVMDWETGGAELFCDGRSFEVFSSHYSLGCDLKGELVAAASVEQLEKADINGKILLLHGEIAAEQIAPKKFPFWNPEEHRHMISVIEKGNPKALVCATGKNAAVAGGVYPFPLFEDGDFDIPSVYMKDTEGEKLRILAGGQVDLVSRARRIPGLAYNIIGRNDALAEEKKRVVVTAHIDTKIDTPGAIDNGTGVTTILLLAELLKNHSGKHPVDLVVFNGEDYYSAPGQVKYMEQNHGKFGDIILNINIDGAGYKEGDSCFSALELPFHMDRTLGEVIRTVPGLVRGLPWYQGDHSVFLQNGCPAVAVSSAWFIENMECQEITHTAKDNLDVVNCERVAECALGVAELIKRLSI